MPSGQQIISQFAQQTFDFGLKHSLISISVYFLSSVLIKYFIPNKNSFEALNCLFLQPYFFE
jgi:hypothetical protein